MSSRDLLRLFAVLLRGGGHTTSDAEVAALPLEAGAIETLATALGDLLAATFGSVSENPPQGAV